MISVTITHIDGVAVSPNQTRAVSGDRLAFPFIAPSTEGNLASAAILFLTKTANNQVTVERWTVTDSYSDVLASLTTDSAESGAEVTTNKVTSLSGASTDTQYPSAKLTYDQLALKAPLASPTFTGTAAAPTAAQGTNTTQIATTQFVVSEFGARVGKLPAMALVAGELIIPETKITANSAVSVSRVVAGGTAAVGGYKVTLNAGVGYTINALQADTTTTETANTDTVMATIIY